MNKSVMSFEKKTIEKEAASVGSKLMNWMPRRGDPGDMPDEPKLTIPKLKIEMLPANTRSMKPVRAPEVKPPPKRHRKGVFLNIRDHKAEVDNRRDWVYGTECYVTTALQLSPWLADHIIQGVWRNKPGKPILFPSGALPNRIITVDLQYPLSQTARVTITPFTYSWPAIKGQKHAHEHTRMSLGYVLWSLAQAYKKIYLQPDKWGIWGHAISDLCFESFKLRDNIGDVGVGS